jgi:protein-tyrosine phosphatase
MTAVTRTRVIDFEGAHNFRDLGGYPSALGGEVRWGMVFRAGRLDQMTADDLVTFESLGIRSVFDLRRDDEREHYPDPMPNVPHCLLSHVFQDGMPDTAAFLEHDHAVRFLADMYLGLLEHAGPEIGALLGEMVADGGLPAVFHCTAGKDRTGIVAALLLTWLGVDRQLVLDDFELTDQATGHVMHEEMFKRMLDRGMAPEAAAGMLSSSRESMAAALDELDSRYGGIERYLLDVAGVDNATLASLRRLLLR